MGRRTKWIEFRQDFDTPLDLQTINDRRFSFFVGWKSFNCICEWESKGVNPVFLGIISASESLLPRVYKSPSAYGWRDINFTVNKDVSNDKPTKKEARIFQSGNEIWLTLDYGHIRISLLHKRTMVEDTMEIDLQTCPLPWQIAVIMVGMSDRVRIF